MSAVWERLVHAHRVKVPDGRVVHHVQAIGAKNAEVDGAICLLKEAVLFRARGDLAEAGDGAEGALHDEFAGEGEDDDVEGHEGEIFASFAIVGGSVEVCADSSGDQWIIGG